MRARRLALALLAAALLVAAVFATASTAPQVGAAHAVTGVVVDADGRPLAGVEVELRPFVSDHQAALDDLAGSFAPPAADRATTGADGRYRLHAPGEGLWDLAARAPGRLPSGFRVGPLFGDEEQPPLALPAAGEVELVVLDAASGEPLAGVLVAAENRDGPALAWRQRGIARPERRRAVTGDDGVARLPLGERETLRLVAAKSGYGTADAESAGGRVTLRLARGQPLGALVLEADRTPVAGAVVLGMPGGGSGSPVPLGVSDAGGRLLLSHGGGQGIRLSAVDADGRRATAGVAALPPDAEEKRRVGALVLEPPPVLAGHTSSGPGGAPLAGAWVWSSDAPHAPVRSDAEGNFSLPLVGPSPTLVRAAAGGHAPAAETFDPTAAAPFALRLEAAARLGGRVVDPAGVPVAGARVEATPTDSMHPHRPRALSADDGAFRLDGLSPGTPYRLTATATGYVPGERPFAGVEAEGQEGFEIVLVPGAVAFGRVVDADEEPVAGARVVLTPDPEGSLLTRLRALVNTRRYTRRAVSGDDGRFELADLPAGRFSLAVSASGHAAAVVAGIELPEGEREVDLGTVLLADGAAIEGRVTDGERRPIAGATVSWRTESGNLEVGSIADGTVTSDRDGRFRIADLEPGLRFDLSVQGDGFARRTVHGVEPPTGEPLTVVLEPAARLAGVVVDGLGAPVADAWLVAHSRGGGPQGTAQSGTTDATGGFEIGELPPGEARVEVRAQGFQPFEEPIGEISAGEVRSDLRLELVRGATVSGRVTDAGGEPLAGVDVQLAVVDYNEHGVGHRAWTDAAGRYLLEGVPAGRLSVAAEQTGYLPAVSDLDVLPGDNRLDFQLDRGLTVAGRVVDDGGAAVPDAEVRLGAGLALFFGTAVTTGADGRFELAGIAPGTHAVSASKEGYAEATLDGLEIAAPVDDLLLVLSHGTALFGSVYGVDPDSLAGVRITASPNGRLALPRSSRVDYRGAYRVEGLAAGSWTVTAAIESGRQAVEEVTIGAGEREVRLDLDLGGDGHAVAGRILLGGRPLAGARVSLDGRDRPSSAVASSDQEGRFRFAGLSSGSYNLAVIDRSTFAVVDSRRIEVDGDLELQLDVAGSEITGRVVDGETGAPLAGVAVRLEATGHEIRLPFHPRATTDEAGHFLFRRVAAGDYRLRAEEDGYAPAAATLSLADGLPADGVELKLAPTRGLTLDVRSSLGSPPAQVRVAALPPGPLPPGAPPVAVFSGREATGENGRVHLDRLPPGTWRLLVAGEGLARVAVEATVPGPPLTVHLEPGASLDLFVPSLAGTGRTGSARLLAADGTPWVGFDWLGRLHVDWELTAGRTRVDQLPAGRWSVEVTAPDGSRLTANVVTTGGGVTEVRVE